MSRSLGMLSNFEISCYEIYINLYMYKIMFLQQMLVTFTLAKIDKNQTKIAQLPLYLHKELTLETIFVKFIDSVI